MNPKAHTDKVIAKETEKKAKDPFRCDNCGATFVSESERQAHEISQHGEAADKKKQ